MAETAEHQPRERSVTCRVCAKRETWNFDACCDVCRAEDSAELTRLRHVQARAEQMWTALEQTLITVTADRNRVMNEALAAKRAVDEYLEAHSW